MNPVAYFPLALLALFLGFGIAALTHLWGPFFVSFILAFFLLLVGMTKELEEKWA